MQEDVQPPASHLASVSTSQWPAATVHPQPPSQFFAAPSQPQAFAIRAQPQFSIPQQPLFNAFTSSASTFRSAGSVPGDDVCVDMQMDEKKPKSVYCVPWTHRRGLAAREACQALAKKPSKKAYRLRARRRLNLTRYLPISAPPRIGADHARICRIADRRKSYAVKQHIRLGLPPRCGEACIAARALLTKAGRRQYILALAPENTPPPQAESVIEEDVEMADAGPTRTLPPAVGERAPLVSTSTSSQTGTAPSRAAAKEAPNFLDLALMEEATIGPSKPANAHQGVSQTVTAHVASTTDALASLSPAQGCLGEARSEGEQAREDSTRQEQPDNAGTQGPFTVDDMTALILSFSSEQTSQETPVKERGVPNRDFAQASTANSG